MAKKKVSSTDLIWQFHQKLRTFDDYPLHGISVALVPETKGDWRAITTRKVMRNRPVWVGRIQSIEKRLRKDYSLIAD